jgi:Fe-S cluster assembly protein SufD
MCCGPYSAATDAVVVHVPAGVKLDQPLHIVQLSTTTAAAAAAAGTSLPSSAPRVIVVMGEGAKASIVEEFAHVSGANPAAAYWHNGVCEIVLEKGANVAHTMVGRCSWNPWKPC